MGDTYNAIEEMWNAYKTWLGIPKRKKVPRNHKRRWENNESWKNSVWECWMD